MSRRRFRPAVLPAVVFHTEVQNIANNTSTRTWQVPGPGVIMRLHWQCNWTFTHPAAANESGGIVYVSTRSDVASAVANVQYDGIIGIFNVQNQAPTATVPDPIISTFENITREVFVPVMDRQVLTIYAVAGTLTTITSRLTVELWLDQ